MIVRIRSKVGSWRIEVPGEGTLMDLMVTVQKHHNVPIEQQSFSYDIRGVDVINTDFESRNTKLKFIGANGIKHGDLLYLQVQERKTAVDGAVDGPEHGVNSSPSGEPVGNIVSNSNTSNSISIDESASSSGHYNGTGLSQEELDMIAAAELAFQEDSNGGEALLNNVRAPDAEKKMTLLGGNDSDEEDHAPGRRFGTVLSGSEGVEAFRSAYSASLGLSSLGSSMHGHGINQLFRELDRTSSNPLSPEAVIPPSDRVEEVDTNAAVLPALDTDAPISPELRANLIAAGLTEEEISFALVASGAEDAGAKGEAGNQSSKPVEERDSVEQSWNYLSKEKMRQADARMDAMEQQLNILSESLRSKPSNNSKLSGSQIDSMVNRATAAMERNRTSMDDLRNNDIPVTTFGHAMPLQPPAPINASPPLTGDDEETNMMVCELRSLGLDDEDIQYQLEEHKRRKQSTQNERVTVDSDISGRSVVSSSNSSTSIASDREQRSLNNNDSGNSYGDDTVNSKTAAMKCRIIEKRRERMGFYDQPPSDQMNIQQASDDTDDSERKSATLAQTQSPSSDDPFDVEELDPELAQAIALSLLEAEKK